MAPLWSTPYMIYILNRHHPGSAQPHNSFTLTVCRELTLWQSFQYKIYKLAFPFAQAWYKNRQKAEIKTENRYCFRKQNNVNLLFDTNTYVHNFLHLTTVCQEGSIWVYRIYLHISRPLIRRQKTSKIWHPHISLRAAGDDVRTGHTAVAERPAASRWRRDAAAATSEITVAAGTRWVVHGHWWWHDAAGEERRSLPVGTSTADSASSPRHCHRPALLAFGQHFTTNISHQLA